ncbi:hypothetical protein F9K96_05350 [Brucella anthropi]|uniref:hypothetical protein n=1 Tax=Brucella anthropi TaxID=529 RepID=UPI00124D9C90|nr:hypothetical protein [Brucella anthropi]KAB2792569.1 hypothetical protein F9K96_05350 [Brucella anthropi]
MTDTKFTPGPWEWETPLGDDCYSIVQAGLDAHKWRFIAHISVGKLEEGEFPRRQCKANANLIAAAPDLYEVVDAMARFDGRNNNHHLKSMAKAAIAKARGEA